MAEGEGAVGRSGKPGYARPVPLKVLADRVSTQENLDRMREQYPDVGLPDKAELMTDDVAAFHTHQLHFRGVLVLDDDHILNMVVERPERGKPWVLNGHMKTDDE